MRDERLRRMRILAVDDEKANLVLLSRILMSAGFAEVQVEADPRLVERHLQRFRPDLILLDLHMPRMDGYAVLAMLRERVPDLDYLPVLVLSADFSAEAKQRALAAGARDFLSKPFDPLEVVLRIENLLETRLLHQDLQGQNERLEEQVRERTASLIEAVNHLTESEEAIRTANEETIRKLAAAAELRDEETGWHIERVGRYTSLLAARLGSDPGRCDMLRLASSMHDVGKIGCPDQVLRKPGTLTPEERAIINEHPTIGHQVLSSSKTEVLQVAATIALTHHERFDGTGYPRGLAGREIPIEGRIVAVADVFDALTSDRIYRSRYPLDEAVEMMRVERSRHFEAEVLDVFLESLDEMLRIRQRYADPGEGTGRS